MVFIEVMVESLSTLYQRKATLSKALLFPFVTILILDALSLFGVGLWLELFSMLMQGTLYIVIAIITHRVILLGDSSVTTFRLMSWSKRETKFLLHILGIFLLIAIFLSFSLLPWGGWLISLILISLVISRLCLVFPAIAIDKDVSFPYSWELTKDYKVLLFSIIIIVPFLTGIPLSFIDEITELFWLSSTLGTLVMVFEVALLSVTYGQMKYGDDFEHF